jgi:hypothetical protein
MAALRLRRGQSKARKAHALIEQHNHIGELRISMVHNSKSATDMLAESTSCRLSLRAERRSRRQSHAVRTRPRIVSSHKLRNCGANTDNTRLWHLSGAGDGWLDVVGKSLIVGLVSKHRWHRKGWPVRKTWRITAQDRHSIRPSTITAAARTGARLPFAFGRP